MFNWLLEVVNSGVSSDIVSGNNKPSGTISNFDNLINIYQENPQEFWIRILALIGIITLVNPLKV